MRCTDEANAYVHEAAQAHPDRILPFGWVDPHLGIDAGRETIRRCVEDYGFHGVKMNGAQNEFFIDDPELSLPLIEAIAETGKLLAFHVGADAFEKTHPFRVAKVARMFPDLTILIAHMGGVGHKDISAAAIEFAAECPNLMLIGSAVRTGAILKAVRELGPERVCFGSDTPFELMHVERARYEAMLDGVLDADGQALVMGGNLLRTLAIEN
jgi:predicted TIM-barrel fold metal-dependent hydrolase